MMTNPALDGVTEEIMIIHAKNNLGIDLDYATAHRILRDAKENHWWRVPRSVFTFDVLHTSMTI